MTMCLALKQFIVELLLKKLVNLQMTFHEASGKFTFLSL
jgi:hypothetical protein